MDTTLQPLTPIDTRELFAPLHLELMDLLTDITDEEWVRPTVAGSWEVRDVVAHLLDGQMRRLSFQRDGAPLPEPEEPISGYRSLVAHLNRLNAEWVRVMRRVSRPQLLALLDRAGRDFAQFVSGLDPQGAAFFPVAWAGEEESRNWMDLGREYTELWHHQAQIRDAVGRPPLYARKWLFPVLDLAIRAVLRSWSDVERGEGTALLVNVAGDAGGSWSIVRRDGTWGVYRGVHPRPAGQVSMSTDVAWRLLFNALDASSATSRVSSSGDPVLVAHFLAVRGVMV